MHCFSLSLFSIIIELSNALAFKSRQYLCAHWHTVLDETGHTWGVALVFFLRMHNISNTYLSAKKY